MNPYRSFVASVLTNRFDNRTFAPTGFKDWWFARRHEHHFFWSGATLLVGEWIWERKNCAHCRAHTWDLRTK